MSLQHTPEGKTAKRVIVACAKAIRALEAPQSTIKPYDITKDDDGDYQQAKRLLWGVLEANGYTIDGDTNRVIKAL